MAGACVTLGALLVLTLWGFYVYATEAWSEWAKHLPEMNGYTLTTYQNNPEIFE